MVEGRTIRCLQCALVALFEVWRSFASAPDRRRKKLAPDILLENFDCVAEGMKHKRGRQEDAQEFFIMLMDTLAAEGSLVPQLFVSYCIACCAKLRTVQYCMCVHVCICVHVLHGVAAGRQR